MLLQALTDSCHGFCPCSYYNGCENTGADCKSGSCSTAFFKPDDTHVQVACQKNNVSRSFLTSSTAPSTLERC